VIFVTVNYIAHLGRDRCLETCSSGSGHAAHPINGKPTSGARMQD